eukprot:170955-Rhodomonas_salina.2
MIACVAPHAVRQYSCPKSVPSPKSTVPKMHRPKSVPSQKRTRRPAVPGRRCRRSRARARRRS